jgi:hypothetical protein
MTDIENEQQKYDSLEELLAQPALIADRGFSVGVWLRLHNHSQLRTGIFAGISACWAVIALLFTSPQAFMASMARLGSLLDSSVLSVAHKQINTEVGTLGQIINQSSLVSLVLLGFLVCTVFVLIIRENA